MFPSTHFKPTTLAVFLLTTLITASCAPINTTTTGGGNSRTTNTVPYGVMIQHCTQPGTVALTFDDGPYKFTPTLLDILSEFDAHATFFVNGNGCNFDYAEYSPVLNRIMEEGHQIGSHTLSHKNLPTLPQPAVSDQMTELESRFESSIGRIPAYMRPPYLAVDAAVLTTLANLGYHVIGADIDTKDYQNTDPGRIRTSLELFKEGLDAGGSIVLAHDVHEQTVEFLAREMLTLLEEKGMVAVTVGDCLGDAQENWYK